jgi:superfamily II DNA/RNA helicase
VNFELPWNPQDYVHRIGRTGRAGDKGIAITLATREDAEAVGAIEKMLGQKIARAGSAPAALTEVAAPAPEPSAEEPAAPAEKRGRRRASPAPEPRAKQRPEPMQEAPRERSPVVEDIAPEWNGPLPGFLSKRAG